MGVCVRNVGTFALLPEGWPFQIRKHFRTDFFLLFLSLFLIIHKIAANECIEKLTILIGVKVIKTSLKIIVEILLFTIGWKRRKIFGLIITKIIHTLICSFI